MKPELSFCASFAKVEHGQSRAQLQRAADAGKSVAQSLRSEMSLQHDRTLRSRELARLASTYALVE